MRGQRIHGETGGHGPQRKPRNLVLDDEVVEAVKDGRFRIYAVSNVDEGVEVLTGVTAGERGDDGSYPAWSVHYLVEERLREMAAKAREFGKGDDGGEQGP